MIKQDPIVGRTYRGRSGWPRYVVEVTSLHVHWHRVLANGECAPKRYRTWWLDWRNWVVEVVSA